MNRKEIMEEIVDNCVDIGVDLGFPDNEAVIAKSKYVVLITESLGKVSHAIMMGDDYEYQAELKFLGSIVFKAIEDTTEEEDF